MTDTIYRWWSNNGGTFTVLAVQAILIIIWGVRLDSRVDTIEQRGTPGLAVIERRLTIAEDRQRTVLEYIKDNSKKIDRIVDELRSHELESKRNRNPN